MDDARSTTGRLVRTRIVGWVQKGTILILVGWAILNLLPIPPAGFMDSINAAGIAALILFLGTFPATPCAVALDQGRRPVVPRVGLMVVVTAILLWWAVLLSEWLGLPHETLRVAATPVTATAIILGLAALLQRYPHASRSGALVRALVYLLVTVLAVAITIAVVSAINSPYRHDDTLILRVIMVTGVLVVMAMLADLALLQFRSEPARAAAAAALRVPVTCPRCAARQEFRIGDNACARCALKVRMNLA